MEYNSSNANIGNALYGREVDEVIARSNNGQGQFSFPDRNGNVSVVLDFSGGTLESYRYDAFGVPAFYNGAGTMLTQSGISNALLYTGREWNQTFGLYEYRARGYDPKLGRFLSEDPKGLDAGDYNLYRYVSNDPLDKTDPMGLSGSGTEPQQTLLQWITGSLIPQRYTITYTESGNVKDSNDENHLTDAKLAHNSHGAHGITRAHAEVTATGRRTLNADLRIDWWVNRASARKHPDIIALEKQHPADWIKWWKNLAQPMLNDFVSSHRFFGDWTAQLRTQSTLSGEYFKEYQRQLWHYEPPIGGPGPHQVYPDD